ncbi:hypothetical protein BKA81DRAFT_420574 [Phyllosticta paracitricarpa]|uniref:Large ribosomal subunit protein mL50 n=1 Tax=Phyllosticta citricarpa TaxID=55181 RepID=A0ABR1MNU0_9PEZI
MRQLTRLTRSIGRTSESTIRPSAFSSVYNTCRQTAAPFSSSSTRAADQQKKKSSLSLESIRRRIWGTDQPPGREDPYDPQSPMRQIEEAQSKPSRPGQEATAETKDKADDGDNALKSGPRRTKRSSSSEGEYKPASTWDGLEWVGSSEWAWKQKSIPNFHGQVSPHWIFTLLSVDRKQHAANLQEVLLKTLIKEVAKQKLSKKVVIAIRKGKKRQDWSDYVDLELLDKTRNLVLKQRETPRDAQAPGDVRPAWFDGSIKSPRLKFQLAERFLKETGIRISDFALHRCNTPEELLRDIKEQLKVMKKEKLAEALKNNPSFDKLSNVKILDRRVTPIDKEKEVGRWKVIEDELLERGLPVTGKPVVK